MNGTLTVMSTASWANASNVTASCAGVLKVQNKEAFGRQAVVHIDGADARMLLDYSGSMKVYGLYIDGQKQPLGVYGGTASGAPRKLACFGDTGTGQLVVVGDGKGTVGYGLGKAKDEEDIAHDVETPARTGRIRPHHHGSSDCTYGDENGKYFQECFHITKIEEITRNLSSEHKTSHSVLPVLR